MKRSKRTVAETPPGRKVSKGAASNAKPCYEMDTAELGKATVEFDREFIGDSFGPLTVKQKARLARAKRKSGRQRDEAG